MSRIAQNSDLDLILWANAIKAIRKGQKEVKGLKLPATYPILTIGDNEGITAAEYGRLWGIFASVAHRTLFRSIKGGWIIKQDKRYYLSEAGQKAYQAMKASLEQSTNELKQYLLAQVRAELKRGK